MNKQFISILLLSLIVFACSEEEEKTEIEGTLYADLPKDTLAIDTIQTGVEFDFKPDTLFPFVAGEAKEIGYHSRSLKRQNVFPKDSAKVIKMLPEYFDTVFNVFPDTIKAEPYIGYLSHPQPQKAEGMVNNKYASENIQTFGVDQGLNSPIVFSMVEDQFGFLWFGLEDGLTRYDGKYLYNYTEENGLIDHDIGQLFIAPDGRMWITTAKGIMIYDGNHLEIYTDKNGLPSNFAHNLRADKEGNIWFLCRNAGLVKYDGEYFYNYNAEKSGLNKNHIFCFGFDHKDQIMISLTYRRPEILNVEENYLVQVKDGGNFYGSTMTLNTFNDDEGHLWTVSYNGGVHHILNDSVSLAYKPKTGVNYLSIIGGLQDSRGNFWFNMQDGGISYDNGSNYIGFNEEGGINSNIVLCMIEDSKGNIWAGTTQGVVKIVPESFNNMTSKDGLTDKPMVGICQSPTGHLLIPTWADGMYVFDGKSFRIYRGGGIVFPPTTDYFGNVVFGAHQDAIKFYKVSPNDTIPFKEQWVVKSRFQTWNIRTVRTDPEGNLWATDDVHGIYCFRLNEDKTAYESIERYLTTSGLIHHSTRNIYFDAEGTTWISYMDEVGVSTVKNGKIQHHNTNSGFPTNFVTQYYEDSKGNLWLCSRDGLILKNGDQFTVFTEKDGLSHHHTTSIIEDNTGRLWVGTVDGLNILEKDDEDAGDYNIASFGIKDGLGGTTFTSGGVLIDSTNTIWWVTSQSLLSLNLDVFQLQLDQPNVTIEDVSVMTDHINFVNLEDTSNISLDGAEFGKSIDYFNVPSSVSLPHDLSSITIKYGSLNGNPTHQIKYRYWLKGFHKYWVKETEKGEAEFTHLPPGDYDFQVQARLANNKWGPVTSYKFEVRKPFWERWWFRGLVLLTIVYLVYVIVRLRNKQLRKRQEELEYTVQQRTFEIEQQKHIIEEKQTEILDSINYAQRIQKSLMATDEMLANHLKDYFVFFQPKDVVSGDFYWATPVPDGTFLVVNADSTGHGVPGAIMSMLNISCLEKATEGEGLKEPAEILDFTRKKVIETLAKDGSKEGGKDGMDCSLVKYDIPNLKMSFAAAHNGIWIIRNNELIEYKADKMPVGKHYHDQEPFTQTEVQLEKGDVVYTFTDGYPDQFGGEKGKKFKYKSLKKLLLQIAHMPMKEQRDFLDNHFKKWKGDLEQLDDVCIIGVRV